MVGIGRLRIGRIAGIDVALHGSFPPFLLLLALIDGLGGGWRQAAITVLSLLVLFALVLLHELGHSLVAQRLGVNIRSITLMPLGGIALMDALPRRPRDEMLIALAGPAVNLALAAPVLLAFALAAGPLDPDLLLGDSLPARFLHANLALALFNLVPAFPLDGGRVLRAGFALRLPYLRATERAVLIGRLLAGLMILLPLLLGLQYLLLGLIGVFLFVAGGRELRGVRADDFLRHRQAGEFLDPAPWLPATRDTAAGELQAALAGREGPAWVVVDLEGGRYGLLSRRALQSASLVVSPRLPLAQLVEEGLLPLPAAMPLGEALQRLRGSGRPAWPVQAGGRIRGVLRRDQLEAALAALQRGRQPESGGGSG
jgi:Zn-dependent protease